MDKADKLKQEARKEHLLKLQSLFQSEGWEDLKKELQQCKRNYDDKLHSVNCEKRDIYVGACMAIDDVLKIEKIVDKEAIK